MGWQLLILLLDWTQFLLLFHETLPLVWICVRGFCLSPSFPPLPSSQPHTDISGPTAVCRTAKVMLELTKMYLRKKKKTQTKTMVIFCSFSQLNWFSKSSSEHQGQQPCWRWEGAAGEQGLFLLAGENLVPELAQQTKSCAPSCGLYAELCMCKQTTGVELLAFQIKFSDQVCDCLT